MTLHPDAICREATAPFALRLRPPTAAAFLVGGSGSTDGPEIRATALRAAGQALRGTPYFETHTYPPVVRVRDGAASWQVVVLTCGRN